MYKLIPVPIVALVACCTCALSGKNGPKVGDSPPALALSDIVQGPAIEEITWQKLKGKVVVLEFWNTMCGPCIQNIPHWNELVDGFSSKQVVFLGVSDDNKDSLGAFLKKRPIKGWLALDRAFNPTRTGFDVVGIPHTVIVDASGNIAAITHPANLAPMHLEEILAGKPSTLPKFAPYSLDTEQETVAVLAFPPQSVEVTIKGPFPQPEGAFNSRGWEKPDYTFIAQKAFLRDTLSAFFDISPHLIIEREKLPGGLYDISAACPPDKMPELKGRFEEALRTHFGIAVLTTTQEVATFAMTVCATNAPVLKATSKRGGGGERPGGFYLNGTDLKGVASYFEYALKQTVVDETGLTGLWDADIKWKMSDSELHQGSADPADVVYAAREQLGLELKVVNRKLRVLVLEMHP